MGGMSNRRPDTRLDEGIGATRVSYLRSIINADGTAAGTFKRRRGYTRELPGGACHSLWSDGIYTFFADGPSLYRLKGAAGALSKELVHDSLVPNAPVSFVSTPLGIFYSDGTSLRRYDASGDRLAGTPMFAVEPNVTPIVGGSLPAGAYEVAFTYRRADGQESPSTLPVRVEVEANGAVAITGLPPSWPETVHAVVIYMTQPNSATLLKVFSLSAPAVSHTITVLPSGSERCATVMLAPMPAGHIVRFHAGRLLVARDNVLHLSEPYAPTLVNPSKGYIPFPAPIDIVEPVDGGVYITADATYWYDGEELVELAPVPGVRGTGGRRPDDRTVFWMSATGLVTGDHAGEIQNLQEKDNAVAPASRGATLVHEHDGMKQIIASLFGSRPTTLVAHSFMEAEVIRKGTKI